MLVKRSHGFGACDTAASNCGSRAREGPGGFQRQSLWSIKVKLCRCHKGSEIIIQCFDKNYFPYMGHCPRIYTSLLYHAPAFISNGIPKNSGFIHNKFPKNRRVRPNPLYKKYRMDYNLQYVKLTEWGMLSTPFHWDKTLIPIYADQLTDSVSCQIYQDFEQEDHVYEAFITEKSPLRFKIEFCDLYDSNHYCPVKVDK